MLVNKLKKLYSAGKIKKNIHPPFIFNNITVSQTNSQKDAGVNLDFKLSFKEHLLNVFKISKTISLLHKLQNLFSRTTEVANYTIFVRTSLNYGDI